MTRPFLVVALALILPGCTGGTFVKYPSFPATSCSTCWDQRR
jgi:hypothetical protein